MTTADIPEEWREFIKRACFALADNYSVWQPFALLLAVGALILALATLVELWGTP
jgi:hypothetical protein